MVVEIFGVAFTNLTIRTLISVKRPLFSHEMIYCGSYHSCISFLPICNAILHQNLKKNGDGWQLAITDLTHKQLSGGNCPGGELCGG